MISQDNIDLIYFLDNQNTSE